LSKRSKEVLSPSTMKLFLRKLHIRCKSNDTHQLTTTTSSSFSISHGFVLLVGISTKDTEAEVEKLAKKVLTIRLFEGENEQPWKSNVKEAKGQILSVSQFTLMARTKKGTKPDFHEAAKGPQAKPLYDLFLSKLRKDLGENNVKDGVFGAMMDVMIVNDGPITINLDTDD
ncbi:hypothetical protein WICPIJ_009021, partial [Wickerhamomyces pijperi]